MATGFASRPAKFVPAMNAPQVVAIAAVPGRLVPSSFGPTEVVFDLMDGRPWYVPQVIADEIYAMGIRARQQIEVTGTGKKKTDVQIIVVQARIPQRVPDRDYTPELTRSLEVQNQRAAISPELTAPLYQEKQQFDGSAKFMGAYKAAIDVLLEAQIYAKRQGLLLDVHCEDVRCLAATIMIQGGR